MWLLQMGYKREIAVHMTYSSVSEAMTALKVYAETFPTDAEAWEELAEGYARLSKLRVSLNNAWLFDCASNLVSPSILQICTGRVLLRTAHHYLPSKLDPPSQVR